MRVFLLLLLLAVAASAEPLVLPYLQNPKPDSVDLYWVDSEPDPVEVEWLGQKTRSSARAAPELDYHPVEKEAFPELREAPRGFLHHVTLSGFGQEASVDYTVWFAPRPYRARFRRLPSRRETVRLVAYSDSETEPESTGKAAAWGTELEPKRRYLVDQTTGYEQNLLHIKESSPDAVLIAGDLVESGGEQRDWDEFWRHNESLAGSIPLLPAPGNHEYYAGPGQGRYASEASRKAIAKYRTYFHPDGPNREAFYYATEIGPVTVISLDSNDSLPHQSPEDSNHYLEAAGLFAPGYHEGGEQRRWLEGQLQEAQRKGQFTIVMFHHCPYSSGPHGFPAGSGEGRDEQSGQPLRALTPLLLRYGADLLLSGHDEMLERSEVKGVEVRPDGSRRETVLQVYDVGIGGDGLRGPSRQNEWRKFLAAADDPERWEDGRLVSGGRHYGHLRIEVEPRAGGWRATLTPVYLLPVKGEDGWILEPRLYPDTVELRESLHTKHPASR